jgi:glyoxylase-like metal-dependent hydrolase (beta-lactamase superfamily II)
MTTTSNPSPATLATVAVAFMLCVASVLAQRRAPAANPPVPSVHVLQVRPSIYMLSGGGANVTVQLGKQGVLLVDAPLLELAAAAFAEIAKLSPAPVRYVVSTSDAREHLAGNEAVATLGQPPGGASRQGAASNPVLLGSAQGMTILAHENVLNRLTQVTGAAAVPRSVLPTSEYYEPTKDFSFNGEPIIVYHMPNAHSDGDSVVLFRNSDVISTGDVFTPDRFPSIDRSRGGSVPRGWHQGDSGPRPAVGGDRRRRVSRHGRDRDGPDSRLDRARPNAGRGARRTTDARLRSRVPVACCDSRHVRRGRVFEPHAEHERWRVR